MVQRPAKANNPPPDPEVFEAAKPRIRELRKAGASYSQISRAVGLTMHLVKKAIVDMGVPPPISRQKAYRLNIPKERVEELLAQGMNRHQMQITLGITNRSLLTLLARYGPRLHRQRTLTGPKV